MEIISTKRLAELVVGRRREKKISQQDLSDQTSINRIMISRIENDTYVPSLKQLESLSNVLDFDIIELFEKRNINNSFVALKSEALNERETDGVDKLISMMLTLRQQIQIRKSFENGKTKN
ncbi:MAG: helix-turn-helix transcriptional regulator [Sphaerochaetaceae bacterium]|nr:helix-turn-helix transcriptional regulator [Sphaerochaetaceae bacterium]